MNEGKIKKKKEILTSHDKDWLERCYLTTFVVKYACYADRHEFGAGPTQRSTTQGKDKGDILFLAHGQNVVQCFIQAPCKTGTHAGIKT